ncbi:MAG: hypothetical protein IMZ61_12200 [Planctomycetes bacterium]|nr:hypothetical protein [Planctomycetota bacterium]
MIKSEIYKGHIYAGATELASTIVVEQTGLMQLTVRKGKFTCTDGTSHLMESDSVFDLVSHPDYFTEIKIEIGHIPHEDPSDWSGIVDIWCGTKVNDGVEEFDPPAGWVTGHPLVFNFVIPAGCTDLTPIDIFVLTVLPGFPEGTTAADWAFQTGDGRPGLHAVGGVG